MSGETLQERVKKLCKVLRDSQLTRKQSFKNLAEIDKRGKIKSYCAIGALGCEKNLIKVSADFGDNAESNIISSYGISDKLKMPVVLPLLYDRKIKNNIHSTTRYTLSGAIIELNDCGKATFTEVAQFIDELYHIGYLKPCSKKQRKDAIKRLKNA